MFPILDVLLMIIKGLPETLWNPFFWITLVIIYFQNKKISQVESYLFGKIKSKPYDKMLYAIFFGLLGGLIGSILVMLLGITITETGIVYVWPIALLLMLIHPRFICFSYAGGLVSIAYLLFGWPKIDVAGLMGLIGLLHLIESLLIFFSGYINASPVLIKDDKYGIVGGFYIQEFWPIPILLLIVVTAEISTQGLLQMPDWWPIIKPPKTIIDNPNSIFLMFPVIAALGYSDIALTRTPKARCRNSALNLMVFSIILLALSVISSYYKKFTIAAALFAPIAHELLIIYGKQSEKKNKPLFTVTEKGERVLDVIKGSNAEKMGIKPGDIILSINNEPLDKPGKYEEIMSNYPTYLWISILTPSGEVKSVEMNAYPHGTDSIGVILVPKRDNAPYIVLKEASVLNKIKELAKKSINKKA